MKPITAPKIRAPKGRNDHEQTKEMNASKRCAICKSQVAYDAHICGQCGSHDFEYGDIQVAPTAPNPVVPQPNQQGPKNMLVHAIKLEDRDVDNNILGKGKKKSKKPGLVEFSWNSVEAIRRTCRERV